MMLVKAAVVDLHTGVDLCVTQGNIDVEEFCQASLIDEERKKEENSILPPSGSGCKHSFAKVSCIPIENHNM